MYALPACCSKQIPEYIFAQNIQLQIHMTATIFLKAAIPVHFHVAPEEQSPPQL